MSKKDKNKPTEAREPWEQSIYDTKEDTGHSRLEKRQYKKGNTVFLTILVILLLLIIALPIGTFWWVSRDKPNENKGGNSTPSSSITSSSTKESSTASSSTIQSSSTAEGTDSSTPAEGQPSEDPADTEPVYGEVYEGEGFKQVAERYGVTIEQIMELNGLGADSIIHPGDTLRVK
ncbi:SAG1386/EF1546 family surface-associated protein [Enterococcus sp. LJL128]|uniref:SAG1386/EF1546 family surface-associated protein n=1 Tax=Enterococcus sp. LJL51 TaxID=3416656 RepID=UPI003CF1BE6B